MSRFNRKSLVASAATVIAFNMFTSAASATYILDNTFDVSFSLYRSFGQWTGTGPDQTGGLIFNAGGEGVARPTSPGFGIGDTTAGEIIENRRPFGDLAIGDGVTEFQISSSESPDSVRDVRQFDATGTAVISFDYKFSFRQVLGDGVTPVMAAAIEAQATTPATIKEFGLRFFDGAGTDSGNRTIVGGLFATPFPLMTDGVVRNVSFTLPVVSPAARAALATANPASNFNLATVFYIVIEGPGGRQFTFDNVDLVQATPASVKGDFGGAESSDGSFNTPDGAFNELDVEGFLLALNDQASYLVLNPALGTTLISRGDFGGNESTNGSFNTPDGAFNELDVEGFLLALNDPAGYASIQPPGLGGVSAIPEPAALGLLAPLGLLMARRRR